MTHQKHMMMIITVVTNKATIRSYTMHAVIHLCMHIYVCALFISFDLFDPSGNMVASNSNAILPTLFKQWSESTGKEKCM